MGEPEWLTSWTVQGVDLRTGDAVPVVVGLVNTAAGGVQVALQVGDHRPVILALQDARRLALNVNETTAERLRVAAASLGDDRPRDTGDGATGEDRRRPRGVVGVLAVSAGSPARGWLRLLARVRRWRGKYARARTARRTARRGCSEPPGSRLTTG